MNEHDVRALMDLFPEVIDVVELLYQGCLHKLISRSEQPQMHYLFCNIEGLRYELSQSRS